MNGPLCSITPHTCEDVDVQAGSTAITGWTVFGGGVDHMGPPWNVTDGAHAVDLNGRATLFSGISQTFATAVGQTYAISFDLSGNPHGGPTIKQLRVTVGDFSRDYSFDAIGQSTTTLNWNRITFFFSGLAPTSMLSFMSLSSAPSSYGPVIDNVQVHAVPEESSVALLLTIAMITIARNRRRHRRSRPSCAKETTPVVVE